MMMPGMPGSNSSAGGGRMLFGGPRDMEGGTGRPAGVAATSTAKTLDNARLVELSIYAIASLYDRFPALPKETVTPGTAPAVPADKK